MLYMAFVTVANYTQPNYELGYALKFMRMLLLVLTGFLGIWGFVIGTVVAIGSVIWNRTIPDQHYLHVSGK
jgi:stage V sporulation protein AF